jgi:site-specific DNA-methyltransferase (cytosine-N4-specific)
MLRELAAVRKLFVVPYKNARIADLLWTAFFKALLAASNQDGDTRYTIVSKDWLRPGYALEQFIISLSAFLADLRRGPGEARLGNSAEVFVGDSVATLNEKPLVADLVVTSPPYINTYDYYLYHKHRLFWYGVDPRSIRAAECGNHHRIDSMSRNDAITEYRNYMAELLKALFRRMRSEAHAVVLIGDGIVKHELVKGDDLLSSLALEAGFRVDDIESSELRSVSSRFIKTSRLDRKRHHIVTLLRTRE